MSLECVLWLLACCALPSEKINDFFKLSIVRTYSFCSSLVVFSLRSNDLAKLDSTFPTWATPAYTQVRSLLLRRLGAVLGAAPKIYSHQSGFFSLLGFAWNGRLLVNVPSVLVVFLP